MNILITGSNGFIGKNLYVTLRETNHKVMTYDKDDNNLYELLDNADFIYHLAGVNRPIDKSEFYSGNSDLTKNICDYLVSKSKNTPILITSSIQATNETDYGISKRYAEEVVNDYRNKTRANIYIYRLSNVFGKWCRPNYNSVVATFCNNIANDLDITINDRNYVLPLIYIDDIIAEFITCLSSEKKDINYIDTVYEVSLGYIADTLFAFKESRSNFEAIKVNDPFIKKLYSTYLTYLPIDKFSYLLKMNVDNRGSFTEILKNENGGQVSVNVAKPSIVKGNHWHHTKTEKFLVVSGSGLIKFRNIFSDNVIEYYVSSTKLEVVDIPPGYTHSIENIGENDLVTIMWANELLDNENPDTYYLNV